MFVKKKFPFLPWLLVWQWSVISFQRSFRIYKKSAGEVNRVFKPPLKRHVSLVHYNSLFKFHRIWCNSIVVLCNLLNMARCDSHSFFSFSVESPGTVTYFLVSISGSCTFWCACVYVFSSLTESQATVLRSWRWSRGWVLSITERWRLFQCWDLVERLGKLEVVDKKRKKWKTYPLHNLILHFGSHNGMLE